MPLGLYISVPFCRTKCTFCNFASDVFSKSAYENYVTRLLEDIEDARHLAAELGCAIEETADSIYLGGGTPSILDASQLLRIFATVRDQFAITPDAEITVECAPSTLTPTLIATLLQCGVNRVSLGVQSFVDQEARSVGRLHNRTTVLEEIGRLQEAGLTKINIDLIAGLPHQTAESWAFSVSETIATGVPHASVYMLEIDDESRLGSELIAGGVRYHAHFIPDEDAIANFYEQACEMLAAAGIAQYEISNFARAASQSSDDELRGSQSRHNLKYWTRQPYLGFGVDAHSMLPVLAWGQTPSSVRVGTAALGCPAERSLAAAHSHWNSGSVQPPVGDESARPQAVRLASSDSLGAYMNRAPYTAVPISAEAAIEESFFLGLRLNRGIDLARLRKERYREVHDFRRATNVAGKTPLAAEATCTPRQTLSPDAIATWESAIQQCLQDGLLEQHDAILRLTARGRLLSNEVFGRFLADKSEETKWEPAT